MTRLLRQLFASGRRVGRSNLESLLLATANRGGVDLMPLAYAQRGILKYRTLEESGEAYFLSDVLPKLVPVDGVMFDVGGNSGEYSVELRRHFPRSRLTAFEPNPETYRTLETRVAPLGVRCVNQGLSDQPGEVDLFITAESRQTGHATIYSGVMTDLHAHSGIEKVRARLTTLDQYCDAEEISRIDFLKIDTEGHELAVLKGACGLLGRGGIGCVQFEFNEMNVISRVWLKDFFEVLPGFVLFRLDSRRLLKLSPYSPRDEIFQFQNIVAIPKDLATAL